MDKAPQKYRLFAEMEEQDRASLLDLAEQRSYGADQVVVREGEPHEGLFLISDGAVEVLRLGEEPGGAEGLGVEESLTRFSTGNFFGDLSVFDPGPASASVRTTRPTRILLIRREILLDFLDSHPQAAIRIYRNLLSELATRLRRLDQKLVERIVWVHEEGRGMQGGSA